MRFFTDLRGQIDDARYANRRVVDRFFADLAPRLTAARRRERTVRRRRGAPGSGLSAIPSRRVPEEFSPHLPLAHRRWAFRMEHFPPAAARESDRPFRHIAVPSLPMPWWSTRLMGTGGSLAQRPLDARVITMDVDDVLRYRFAGPRRRPWNVHYRRKRIWQITNSTSKTA